LLHARIRARRETTMQIAARRDSHPTTESAEQLKDSISTTG